MKIIVSAIAAVVLSCNTPQQQEHVNKRLTATEYKEHHANTKEAMLVDVRTPAEFKAGHLQKAQNSDFRNGQFQEELTNWDKTKTYYLYCASGNRSSKAAKLMEAAGFRHIYDIGGYTDLKEAGLPVTENQKQ